MKYKLTLISAWTIIPPMFFNTYEEAEIEGKLQKRENQYLYEIKEENEEEWQTLNYTVIQQSLVSLSLTEL